jgi:hypothetical protein
MSASMHRGRLYRLERQNGNGTRARPSGAARAFAFDHGAPMRGAEGRPPPSRPRPPAPPPAPLPPSSDLPWDLPAEEPSTLSWPPTPSRAQSLALAMDRYLDDAAVEERTPPAPARRPQRPPELDDATIEAALGEMLSQARQAPARSIPFERPSPPRDVAPRPPGETPPAGTAPAEDPHGVFDRMGHSMRFANTFNLGRIDVAREFQAIEAGLDLDGIADAALGLASGARAPSHQLGDEELAAELSALLAAPVTPSPAPAKPPATPAPPSPAAAPTRTDAAAEPVQARAAPAAEELPPQQPSADTAPLTEESSHG